MYMRRMKVAKPKRKKEKEEWMTPKKYVNKKQIPITCWLKNIIKVPKMRRIITIDAMALQKKMQILKIMSKNESGKI